MEKESKKDAEKVETIVDKDKREFALKEYDNLRKEIVDKMSRQETLLGLGVGGISLIMGYVFVEEVYELFFVLPFLIFANALLYKLEKQAIVNAGAYIKKIENSIYRNNSNIKKRVEDKVFGDMGWENYVKRKKYILCDIAADIIYGGLYVMSVVGAYLFLSNKSLPDKIYPSFIDELAIILYLLIIVFWLYLIGQDYGYDKIC